jgi:alanine dehydrogenase
MIVGVVKEIKNHENRVALTPAGTAQLVQHGHQVLVEQGAGIGSGFLDEDYELEGAIVCARAKDVWAESQLLLKVKEPLPDEFGFFRHDLMVFTYLHLAAAPDVAHAMLASGVTGIAYETIQNATGQLPLLTPMSEVAGKMAVQIGAQFLERSYGGRGILLGGVPGVPPAEVIVIGGGTVGTNAARIALGMGASVVIIDKSAERLRYIDEVFGGHIRTLMSNPYNIANAVQKADLLIGAVLVPGGRAPKLVSEEMVKKMKAGAVIIDVAVDQGACVETIDRVTTHSDPVYMRHGVVHYAVANMPGAVPRTSTFALTNVTVNYVLELADKGFARAVRENSALRMGVNTYAGACCHPAVAAALQVAYEPLPELRI